MSLQEMFWAAQKMYLTEVFLPVIIAFLLSVPLLVALFVFGYARHQRLWSLGQAEDRSGRAWERLWGMLAVAVVNMRIVNRHEIYPGMMHALILGGAAVLILGKIVRLFSYLIGINVPPQSIYLYASMASEIGAVALLIGGGLAVYRRYIVRPDRLDNKPEDSLVFVWVFVIVLTGLMVKGYRIASSEVSPVDWAMWSPVGYTISHIFPTFMLAARDEILVWHRAVIHTIPAIGILGYIWLNRSRLQHIVLSSVNIYLRSFKPKGALTPIDFETTELFGVSKIEEFTWKQLLDLDACTRCGRCQAVCPANISGKALNPKKVIQDLKDHLYEVYPVPLLRKPIEDRKDMISEAISEEVIWDCTTCRACMEACPVYIEHVNKIVDMRRNLAMERSEIPEAAQDALKSLGAREHPWRGTTATRTDWADGLGIKMLADDSEVDILYWVGCTAALDERNMKVARATARILKAAGINFGILGTEEACCGDPARRMGDEYLYQTLCQKNIEVMKGYEVKKIIATCPHCFNTLKHEYPQFGGEFQVVHHTQFILDLIRNGTLKFRRSNGKKAVYHDSCYLGRYNDIYSQPREILSALGLASGLELSRHGSRSFCCGGGGGHMWMEEDIEKRLNVKRTEEVIAAKADLVATACPYCLSMFEDGLKAKEAEENINAMDLSELLAQSLDE